MAAPDALAGRLGHWLKRIDFANGNPFATAEAGRERAWLQEFFVDTGEYDLIWGDPTQPQTSLIFAPQGSGKTAYRIMLEARCYPAGHESNVLGVPYTSFGPLLARLQAGRPIDETDHLAAILKNGVQALLDTLLADVERPPRLSRLSRYRLAWYCRRFAPAALSAPALWERVDRLARLSDAAWDAFESAVAGRNLAPLLRGLVPKDDPRIALLSTLADGHDIGDEAAEAAHDPAALLAGFTGLVQQAGLLATYVLVDRLDETPATSADPAQIVGLIEPLLADLALLETPGVAFKFFLPAAVEAPLRAVPRVRSDRLRFVSIRWTEDLLVELLRRRVAAFSAGRIHSLAQVCTSGLAPVVETEMARWANRSPRRLLRFGELLLLAHMRAGDDDSLLLTEQDWQRARGAFLQEHLPSLWIDPGHPRVLVGREPYDLTALEYRFLSVLQASGGWCGKEELIARVWETTQGVTDMAVSRLVRRIREKIEPNASDPVYLVTEHNLGFRLDHLAAAPAPPAPLR